MPADGTPQTEDPEVRRLRDILSALPVAVLATDPQGVVERLNGAAARLLQTPAVGQRLRDVLRLDDERHRPIDLAALEARVRSAQAPVQLHRVLLVRPGGQEVPVSVVAHTLAAEEEAHGGAVWVLTDAREEYQHRQQLSVEARHDPLTGLVNRAEFERRLVRAAQGGQRQGAEHAVCFLDLDGFKCVNDRFGHAAGDAVLRAVAARLLARIRGRDTLARLGGDEFALLLEHCPLAEATRLAETLVATVSQEPFHWEGEAVSVGLSVGLVALQGEAVEAAALLRAADEACYRAKSDGRCRVVTGAAPAAPEPR